MIFPWNAAAFQADEMRVRLNPINSRGDIKFGIQAEQERIGVFEA
jgi:hypothetical protein